MPKRIFAVMQYVARATGMSCRLPQLLNVWQPQTPCSLDVKLDSAFRPPELSSLYCCQGSHLQQLMQAMHCRLIFKASRPKHNTSPINVWLHARTADAASHFLSTACSSRHISHLQHTKAEPVPSQPSNEAAPTMPRGPAPRTAHTYKDLLRLQ